MMRQSDSASPLSRAGRPTGTGPYREPTKPVRLPLSVIPRVQTWLDQIQVLRQLPDEATLPATTLSSAKFPFYLEPVHAGFPSPAQGYEAGRIDLNDLVISNPSATYFLRAVGDSMVDAGIAEGDLLAVDFSCDPKPGDIVIARLADSFTVKRLHQVGKQVELRAENAQRAYPPIQPKEGEELVIIGVVKWIIRRT